jgi:hypothetical protein
LDFSLFAAYGRHNVLCENITDGVSDDDHKKTVPKYEVYDAYIKYCNYYHLTPESESSFNKKLLKEFKYEWQGFKYVQIGKKKQYFWVGITIKEFKPTEDDDQETLI